MHTTSTPKLRVSHMSRLDYQFTVYCNERLIAEIFFPHSYSMDQEVKMLVQSNRISDVAEYAQGITYAMELFALCQQATEHIYAEKAAKAKAEQEERERQYKERVERDRIAREAREAKVSELVDTLKWMIGERIRLKRRGYRATVFGTIDHITDKEGYRFGWIQITTEKDKWMEINLRDVMILQMRDPDGSQKKGSYHTIYEDQYDGSKF